MKTFDSIFNLLLMTLLVKGPAATRGQGGKSVLCYLEGMSAVRPHEEARFTPEDLDVTICTHVVYNRALVSLGLEVVPRDTAVDLRAEGGKGLYNRTLALKELQPGLKVFIDVYDYDGGLTQHVASRNRSALVAFARNAADFVQSHGFDGMNFRLRYTEVFDEVAPILHLEFVRRAITLTTFLLPPDILREVKFEVTEAFSRNFDLIVVGSYWRLPEERTQTFSSQADLERVVDGYKTIGIPPEKLVVAIPAFSVSLRLCDRSEGGVVGAHVCGSGDEGDYEPAKMILHSSELMRKMANTSEDWVIVRDQASKLSYGHSKSLQWASFEDPESVRAKARFILERNMAGAAIMNVDMEDFKGAYSEGGETFPLARAAFKALNGEP